MSRRTGVGIMRREYMSKFQLTAWKSQKLTLYRMAQLKGCKDDESRRLLLGKSERLEDYGTALHESDGGS